MVEQVTDTLPCPNCKVPFGFFSPDINKCPQCAHEITTNILIKMCRDVYVTGDDWWEEGGECVAGCHVCQHAPNSVSILKVSGVVFHALIEDGQQLTVHIVMSM